MKLPQNQCNSKFTNGKVTGIVNLQSVLINSVPHHNKNLQLLWDLWSAENDSDDLSISNEELEVNSWMFNTPPAAIETDGENNEEEVPPPPPHSNNNEDNLPVQQKSNGRKRFPPVCW